MLIDNVQKMKTNGTQLEFDKEKFMDNEFYISGNLSNLCKGYSYFYEFVDNNIIYLIYDQFLIDTSVQYTYCSINFALWKNTSTQNLQVDAPKLNPGYTTALQTTSVFDDFILIKEVSYYLPCSNKLYEKTTEETFNNFAIHVICNAEDNVFLNSRKFQKASYYDTDLKRNSFSMFVVR